MKKNYTISISKSGFWFVFFPFTVVLSIIGGLAGMFAVDRLVMPRIVGVSDRGVIDVPDITGMQWQEARQRLYDIHLRLHVSEREYHDSIPADVIMVQQPPGGEKVRKGRHIGVLVSNGSEVSKVPSVKNLTEAAARRTIRDAGFSDISILWVYNEEFPKNAAVGAEPPSGIKISREAPVVIRLSRGPKPTHATTPNVIGEMLSDARQSIEENGLTVGRIEYRTGTSSRPGTVVSQSVSPGTSLIFEGAVDLVVAAGM